MAVEENAGLLERLLREYLEAADQGRDIGEELLARAGPVREELAERIRLEREMGALSSDLAVDGAEGPKLFGRFQVLGTLGKGGIGRVLLAHDPKLGRRIALKTLDHDVLLDRDQRAWILNEARSLARIDHPGVVKIYEVGESGRYTWVAMELLAGPSLHDVIQEWQRERGEQVEGDPPLGTTLVAERLRPFSARIALLARLAEALACCHDHGILHRDVKPRNVLFDAEGKAKLIDFGLAHVEGADEDSRLGLTQSLVGTAAYLAPEQISSQQTGADPRSDQFAFATLAYETLALENPFQRTSQRAIKLAIEAADPPPLRFKAPAVPPDLARVLGHAHCSDPGGRYAGMAALAADLRAILESRPISVAEPSLAHLARLWLKRHRRGVRIAGAAFGLALVLWSAAWSTFTLRERAGILRQLEPIHPEGFSTQADFLQSFEPLFELQQAAQDYETGLLRARLWGGVSGDVETVIHAWSRRLGEVLALEQAERGRLGMSPPLGLYPQLFLLDSVLCPGCPYNEEPRARGTVEFPEEVLAGREWAFDLYSLIDVPPPNIVYAFRETPLVANLVAGTYRLQVWERGAQQIFAEVVFFVPEGWPARRRTSIAPPRAELVARTDRVPGMDVELLVDAGTIAVPAFRVLDHLVTIEEYDRFVAETGQGLRGGVPRGPPRNPTQPVWVDYDSAMAFAAWAGGRLPTRLELEAAQRSGLASRPDSPAAAGGEFLLDMVSPFGFDPAWRAYTGSPDRQILMASRSVLTSVVREGAAGPDPSSPPGFRLVFCDDSPQAYRRLAEQPVQRRGK